MRADGSKWKRMMQKMRLIDDARRSLHNALQRPSETTQLCDFAYMGLVAQELVHQCRCRGWKWREVAELAPGASKRARERAARAIRGTASEAPSTRPFDVPGLVSGCEDLPSAYLGPKWSLAADILGGVNLGGRRRVGRMVGTGKVNPLPARSVAWRARREVSPLLAELVSRLASTERISPLLVELVSQSISQFGGISQSICQFGGVIWAPGAINPVPMWLPTMTWPCAQTALVRVHLGCRCSVSVATVTGVTLLSLACTAVMDSRGQASSRGRRLCGYLRTSQISRHE